MIPFRTVRHVPSTIPIMEWGNTPTLPVNGQVIQTPWIDTFRASPEKITQGSAATLVDTVTIGTLGGELVRYMGMFLLDIFVAHDNAGALALTLDIRGEIAPPLITAVTTMNIQSFTVPPGMVAFIRNVRIPCRLFKAVLTYPASNATNFRYSLALRSI